MRKSHVLVVYTPYGFILRGAGGRESHVLVVYILCMETHVILVVYSV